MVRILILRKSRRVAKNTSKHNIDLEAAGFDQIPTGSNDLNNPKSIGNTVDFCRKCIDDKRLLGFLQT